MIKPDFFDSGSLAECSHSARLLFIGLWVMGNDRGCQKWAPRKMMRQVFPYDDVSPAEFLGWMAELEAVGCVMHYRAGGEDCVLVPNFGTYQTVKNPSKSTVPEPPEGLASSRGTDWFQRLLAEFTGKASPGIPQGCPTASDYRENDVPERDSCGDTPVLPQGYPTPGEALTPNCPPNKERSKEVISSSPYGEEEEITLGDVGMEGGLCPECGSGSTERRGDHLMACPSCGSVWEVRRG